MNASLKFYALAADVDYVLYSGVVVVTSETRTRECANSSIINVEMVNFKALISSVLRP